MRSLMRSNWQARFPGETGLAARALRAQAASQRLSDTSRNRQAAGPMPSPLAPRCTQGAGGKVDKAWRLGGGVGGRLLGPQAEAGAHEMQWLLSLGPAQGRGFGESPLPRRTEDEERSCRCPWKGGSFLGPFAYGP